MTAWGKSGGFWWEMVLRRGLATGRIAAKTNALQGAGNSQGTVAGKTPKRISE